MLFGLVGGGRWSAFCPIFFYQLSKEKKDIDADYTIPQVLNMNEIHP